MPERPVSIQITLMDYSLREKIRQLLKEGIVDSIISCDSEL